MKQINERDRTPLQYAMKFLCLSVLGMLLSALVTVPSSLAQTARVTIAQTSNLNGMLFAYKSSG